MLELPILPTILHVLVQVICQQPPRHAVVPPGERIVARLGGLGDHESGLAHPLAVPVLELFELAVPVLLLRPVVQVVDPLVVRASLDDLFGALAPARLVHLERRPLRGRRLVRDARQALTQHAAVFERHAGAAGQVRQRGVHGVAQERKGRRGMRPRRVEAWAYW